MCQTLIAGPMGTCKRGNIIVSKDFHDRDIVSTGEASADLNLAVNTDFLTSFITRDTSVYYGT